MSNTFRYKLSRAPRLAGAIGILLFAAACGGSSTAGTASGGGSAAAKSGAVVNTAASNTGKILVDAQGRTLYAFAADKKGHSNCNGSCLSYWPPVPAGAKAPTAAAGVTATLGVLHRSDGTDQLTADGRPLYTYVRDSKPGATTGQGTNLFGGLWWVVSPSGTWITKASTASSKSTKSPSGRYGTGY